MVKKIVTKEAIYETQKVQVGERDNIKWVTSDMKEFDDEKSANYHEFYNLKVNMRYFGESVNIFNFATIEDLDKYLKDYGYNVDVHDYNRDELVFPNTYVLSEDYVENEEYGFDEYDLPEKEDIYLRIYKFDEYKEFLINNLEKLRK